MTSMDGYIAKLNEIGNEITAENWDEGDRLRFLMKVIADEDIPAGIDPVEYVTKYIEEHSVDSTEEGAEPR